MALWIRIVVAHTAHWKQFFFAASIFNQPQQCSMTPNNCNTLIGIWGVGAVGQCNNDEFGFLIGTSGYKYAILQVIYSQTTLFSAIFLTIELSDEIWWLPRMWVRHRMTYSKHNHPSFKMAARNRNNIFQNLKFMVINFITQYNAISLAIFTVSLHKTRCTVVTRSKSLKKLDL